MRIETEEMREVKDTNPSAEFKWTVFEGGAVICDHRTSHLQIFFNENRRTTGQLPNCTRGFTVSWTRPSHTYSSISGTGVLSQLVAVWADVTPELRLAGQETCCNILHQKFMFPKNGKMRKKSTNKSHLCKGDEEGWRGASSQVLPVRRAASSSRPGGTTQAFTGTGKLTHGCAPFLGLHSALPKRSERPTEKEWGWLMRRRAEWGWRQGVTCGRRGGCLIRWPWGRRRAWVWTCPCRGWFSVPPSAASDGPAPASYAPRESFSAAPQCATDPRPVAKHKKLETLETMRSDNHKRTTSRVHKVLLFLKVPVQNQLYCT